MKDKDPKHEAWKLDFINEIRKRSSKPNSELRREGYREWERSENNRIDSGPMSFYHANPQMQIITPEDYYAYHNEEDTQRDIFMITSFDLFDLYLSELDDFNKTKMPGFLSSETRQIINKVGNGIIWATDANIRYNLKRAKDSGSSKSDEEIIEDMWPFVAKGIPHLASKIAKANNYNEKLKSIHQMLNAIHGYAEGNFANGAQNVVRDLDLGLGVTKYGYAGELMIFLSKEL